MHMIFCDKLVCVLKRRGYSDIALDAGVPNWALPQKRGHHFNQEDDEKVLR